MILSHRHRFLFLKTMKTAGTSTEIALSGLCGPKGVITAISAEDEAVRRELGGRGPQNDAIPLRKLDLRQLAWSARKRRRPKFRNHDGASKVKQHVDPEVWRTYFKMAVVRNPWDRFVSFYFWRGGDARYGTPSKLLQAPEMALLDQRGRAIYCIDGEVVVDRIYRYEDLPGMMEDLSQRLGVEVRMPDYRAKGRARTDRRSYREILTDADAEAIAERFAWQIERFGYTF